MIEAQTSNATTIPRLLRVPEVADILAISELEVRRALREGVLPGVRVGCRWRLSQRALAEFIDRGGSLSPAQP